MRVRRSSSSFIKLLKSGDKCWTTTKAAPLSAGILSKNSSNARSPPAEAPMPTTKQWVLVSSDTTYKLLILFVNYCIAAKDKLLNFVGWASCLSLTITSAQSLEYRP